MLNAKIIKMDIDGYGHERNIMVAKYKVPDCEDMAVYWFVADYSLTASAREHSDGSIFITGVKSKKYEEKIKLLIHKFNQSDFSKIIRIK